MSKLLVGIIGAAAVGTIGYLAWKRFGAQTSAPAGTVPAGTNSSGVKQYIDQAGNLVDAAGNVLKTAQGVVNQLLPNTSLANLEGKLIHRENEPGQYVVINGKKRWAATWALVDKYKPTNGRNSISVPAATFDAIPMGDSLNGLGCACQMNGLDIDPSKLLVV